MEVDESNSNGELNRAQVASSADAPLQAASEQGDVEITPQNDVEQTESDTIPPAIKESRNSSDHVQNHPVQQTSTVTSVPNANRALAMTILENRSFSYKALAYNSLMAELLSLDEMPLPATAAHFRKLRDFVTRFVRLCQQHRIDVAYLTPLLIGNVIASFNREVFHSWTSQVVTAPTSLTSFREFLTTQEQLASDDQL